MKRIVLISILILGLTGTCSFAQMGQGMMGEGRGMPMMRQVMGQGMVMQEMMQTIMDMVKMQEKMLMGIKTPERKEMINDLTQMKKNMHEMMSRHRSMMGQSPDDLQAGLTCAEEWLKKAIDLHELHMKDPTTITAVSQMELMEQIKKAYECVKGTEEMKPKKEEEKDEKSREGDPHGH